MISKYGGPINKISHFVQNLIVHVTGQFFIEIVIGRFFTAEQARGGMCILTSCVTERCQLCKEIERVESDVYIFANKPLYKEKYSTG